MPFAYAMMEYRGNYLRMKSILFINIITKPKDNKMNIQTFKQIIKSRQKARAIRQTRRLTYRLAIQSLRERKAI
jgi:hypothetical protein